MGFQVSPGVNVTEIDLTTIVPAVATSLGGIAGYFEWGPGNTPTLIDTPKTLRQIFGNVTDYNYEEYFTALNFLSYSQGLYVVRTIGKNDAATNANSNNQTGDNGYAPTDEVDITSKSGGFYAKYVGSIGDSLAVSIGGNSVTASWPFWSSFARTPDSSDNLTQLNGGVDTNDLVHIAVVDEDGKFTGTRGTVLERFDNVSLHPKARTNFGTSNYFKNVINDRSQYVKVGGKLDTYDLDENASGLVEFFGTNGLSASGVSNTNWDDVYAFSFAGGASYKTISLTQGKGQTSGTLITNSADNQGYEALSDAEKLDISLIMAGGMTATNYVSRLVEICEDRKDCIAFFSSPVGKNGADITKTDSEKANICINFKAAGIGSSSYAVVDSGYKKQFDQYNQVYRWIPMNGDIAGVCARTEFTNDAWVSPGGYNRGILNNAEALAFNPNRTFRDRIYPKGINPVIFERGTGIVLLGDRTALSKPSAFDRINVRRLFIVLQKAISTASKFSLFEFNDDFTRSRFVSLVTPFLRDVQSRRGIIDFKVVCNEGNNTAEVIDRNEFVADIYIKPNRSINYIQLNFVATRSGADFNEFGA
jgi:phage tail sheath protein FI